MQQQKYTTNTYHKIVIVPQSVALISAPILHLHTFLCVLSGTDKAFLGATDLEMEGDWVWDYSREHLVDTYTAWANGQPDNNLGNENYLEYRSTIGGWNDVNNPGPFFGVAKPYICERSESNRFSVFSHLKLIKGGKAVLNWDRC